MASQPGTTTERFRPRPALSLAGRLTAGGTAGNERLTALTGTALIVLLAVIGVTILRVHTLLWVHLFVGLVLLGPVALKMGSTGYRFVRYYTGDETYRRKGPPPALLRGLAPFVIVTTVVVFASGVALLFAGPGARATLLPLHKVSFIAWLAVTAIHVLGHLREIPAALRADHGRAARWSTDVTGRAGRSVALAGALVAGLVVAVLLIPEFSPWMHWNTSFHHGGH